MSFKFALLLLLLFGFVALAATVSVEDTEKKAVNPEAPLEETDSDEKEDDMVKNPDEELEMDDNEEEPENEVLAKEEDHGIDKRGWHCGNVGKLMCYRKRFCHAYKCHLLGRCFYMYIKVRVCCRKYSIRRRVCRYRWACRGYRKCHFRYVCSATWYHRCHIRYRG